MKRGRLKAIAVLSSAAVVLALVPEPVAADGNANLHLFKFVDPAQLTITPSIGVTLAVDKANAIPGDKLTYTAVVTNPTATFAMGGYFNAQSTASADATVAYYWDELEYCGSGFDCGNGIGSTHWIAAATFERGLAGYTPITPPQLHTGLTLAAQPVIHTGVQYPTSGDPILGTVIQPKATATWTYMAQVTLTPAQMAVLADPAQATFIRNVLHLEITVRNVAAAQPATDPEIFTSPFTSTSSPGAIHNITVTFTLPDGTTSAVGSAQVPGLGLLDLGGSATAKASFTVPAPGPRTSGETESAYAARLAALDGAALVASAVAAGTGFSGPVYATTPTVSTLENVPIVTIVKSGPATIDAGNTETNALALTNIGGAAASGLAVDDSVPGGAHGKVTGVPATLASGGSADASAAFDVPVDQSEGNLTDTASVTWKDANGNSYGSFTSSFTTVVRNPLIGGRLTLAPITAGPNTVGGTQTLTATLVDRNGDPLGGRTVTLAVTGPNAITLTATTSPSGDASFTYTGAHAGNDIAQATFTAGSVTLTSNTSSISWGTPLQPVVTSVVDGNFFPNPNPNACAFGVGPGSTPAFEQQFPDILFNPPTTAVPHDISAVSTFTRPFTDLTVDVNGNYNGQIVAQGNGLQAGLGSLENFYAELTGTFTVNQAGDLTFGILHDDGYFIGIGGSATRLNGDFEGNPPATTPFNNYPVVAAWNTGSQGSSSSGTFTVHFPAAGTYPYELDYTECQSGPLFLVLQTSKFLAQTDPLSVYVGYADGLRPAGSIFPFPWQGSPNVIFEGGGCCDNGAIRFDNSGTDPITFDSIIVDIGPFHYDLWPRNVTLPPGQILILTGTGGENFDTSDTPITCTPTGYIPAVHVTRGGVTTTFNDTTQVLNTKGVDQAVCTGGNESQAWTRIGGGGNTINVPLPPGASLDISPFKVANAIVGQDQKLTVSAMDGAGNPVANLPVRLQVIGANTQSLDATTLDTGLATFHYVGFSAGTDSIQATAFVGGLREVSNAGSVTWSNPGGGGGGNGLPPPAITAPTPSEGSVLTKPVSVDATINPPAGEAIASWQVSVQSALNGTPRVLGSGTGSPPHPLAVLDPTILTNGTYVVTISATASGGGVQQLTATVGVNGNLKLGRYITTSQDLHAPVNGFQIQVLRSYDSLDKTRGDFGVGWHVGLSNFRIAPNRALGAGGWTQYNTQCFFGLCLTAFRNSAPRFVTVTFPDQHTEIFDFTPGGGTNIFWDGTAAFTARPGTGTFSTLQALDTAVSYTGDGNLYGAGGVYDPQRFQLTTRDGRVLILDRTVGLVSETDPNGNSLTVSAAGVVSSSGPSITFDRDAQGRITRIHGTSGELLNYSYSAAGDLETYTDANNQQTSFTYDADHNLKSISGPNGPVQTLNYTDGRLTSATDGAGNTTQISNDVAGQRQTVLDPNQKLTTIYTYDDLGDVIQLDRIFGTTTLTEHWTYDTAGHVLSYKDAAGNPSSAVYDTAGNLVKVTDANGSLFQYTYNSFGQLTSVIDPNLSTIQSYVYDSHGNLTEWNRADHSQFLYQHNAGGLVSQITDPAGRVTKYDYDANGHLSQVTYNAGNVIHVTADASGRVTQVVDSNGKTTRYTYDGLGDLASVSDDNSHQWLYAWDFQSRLTQVQDPLGHQRKYQYDPAGNLTQITDRDGRLIEFRYDEDGRVIAKTLPGNEVTTYVYDPIGRLVEAANANSDVKFAFDAIGNISQTTSTGTPTSNQPTVSLSFGYDATGNRTSISGPDGQSSFGYNVWSQLTSVKDPSNRPFTLTYDTSFRLSGLQRPNGVNDAYTYDASDVLTGIASTRNGASVLSLSYGLDANGRASSVSGGAGTSSFSRDPLGQLTGASYAGGAFPNESFQYDGAGNRTAGANGPLVYDAANRLASDASATYLFDDEGSMTQRTDASGTTRFNYNADHRLLSITHPDSTVTSFKYDPLGRRIEINDAGAITRYVYDGDNIHLEYDGSNNLVASYVDGPGTDFVLEMVRGGQPYYYLRDQVGSTTALVDGSGAVVDAYRYTAFGSQVASGSVTNPFTYTGREYDSKSGLYYYRDRWYDPRTGRFISEDPIPAVNLYPYANNDPVTYSDPTGDQAFVEYETNCSKNEVFVYAGRKEGGCYIGISNNVGRRYAEHGGEKVFENWVALNVRGLDRLEARGVEQKLIELLREQGYSVANKINSIARTSEAYEGAVGFGFDLITSLDLLAAVLAACLP